MSPEPLAVVGIACRFPSGADTPETFWQTMINRVDAIGPVPEERRRLWMVWGDIGGFPPFGGFLPDIDRFDPAFFRLSPREARHIDPQQRLLLELTWETFEDAGYPAEDAAGKPIGVFVGIYLDEYWDLQRYIAPSAIDGHTHTGGTLSIAANRISHVFDLRGPSLSVDTACSSSLTAVHLACRSVWAGECEAALAGGVNLLLNPRTSLGFERAAMLSPDGRCKAFDTRADGYGRSDGAGLVMIRPLDKALADGDRIYALIRGTAINQDGHTVGMTVPRADAQTEAIRSACREAGITPHDLFYVETHGTGTPAGDPIETRAIWQATDGKSRCRIGSVKTIIGHTEAAAGIAGLIKTALALKKKIIPPNLHFVTPHPNIPLETYNLEVVSDPTCIPDRVYAGVNSFGFGGANAHVTLSSAPEETETRPVSFPLLLPFSAHTREALATRAHTLSAWLDHPDSRLEQLAAALTQCSPLDHRAALVCHDRASAAAALAAFPGEMETGMTGPEPPAIAYVFTGMGPQSWDRAEELYHTEPVFRTAVEAADEAFRLCSGWSVLEEINRTTPVFRIHQTALAQPADFILQMGVSALLAAWGVRPSLIAGHSTGETSAACVAGVIDLATAARIVYHRSRLQQTLAGKGRMIAVGISPQEAEEILQVCPDTVSLAAVNSPVSVTLSGDPAAIETLENRFSDQGLFCRSLPVDVAFHSPQMEKIREDFLSAVGDVETHPAAIRMVSTVTEVSIGARFDATYWWDNIRKPVRLDAVCPHLPVAANSMLIQIGPHPVLTAPLLENLAHLGKSGTALPTLQRGRSARESLLETLSVCYVRGINLRTKKLYPGVSRATLPPYPWQRERYWIDEEDTPGNEAFPYLSNPLLGKPLSVSVGPDLWLWSATVNEKRYPYLTDHRIGGHVVLPAAFYMEMAFEAGPVETPLFIDDVDFSSLLTLTGSEHHPLQLTLATDGRWTIASRPPGSSDDAGDWTRRCGGRMKIEEGDPKQSDFAKPDYPPSETGETFYRRTSDRGYGYGPAFRCLSSLWIEQDRVVGRIDLTDETQTGAYRLYPPLLDTAIQTALALLPDDGTIYVPISVARITFCNGYDRSGSFWATAHRTSDQVVFDVMLYDRAGRRIARLQNIRFETVYRKKMDQDDLALLTEQWVETPIPSPSSKIGRRVCVVAALDTDVVTRNLLTTNPHTIAVTGTLADLSPDVTDVVWLSPVSERDDAGCISLLEVVRKTVAAPHPPRLYIVTTAGQAVHPEDHVNPWTAPVWGLRRVAALEHPELRAVAIDLPESPSPADAVLLADLFGTDDPQPEWAIRTGKGYTRKLRPVHTDDLVRGTRVSTRRDVPFALSVAPVGSLENLYFRESTSETPGPGQVALRPLATGLNFRDVMTAMALLPALYANRDPVFGWECVGRVMAVGPKVAHVRVGDRVWGVAPGCFASEVVVDARLALAVPDTLKTEDAATIPLAYLTAFYGLIVLGRLRPGECVLIHSASGGVGLAAIRIALDIGAEVFATAGNEAKRAYLSSFGVSHVMDSRTIAFADRIMDITGGKGVDVVLNSLSGKAMYRSLDIVASHGRFVEIGKTDLLEHRTVDLNRFERNVSYHAVDLARMTQERPDLVGAYLETVTEKAARGEWMPLPCTVFPAQRTEEAFRTMAGARHTGKIVVTVGNDTVPVRLEDRVPLFLPDATYLVVGGTGGLGRLLTRYLVAGGAGHIVLTGMREMDAERSVWMDTLSAHIRYAPVDTGDLAGMWRLFSDMRRDLPPLRGVFHCAGVVDDGILIRHSAERMTRVMRPKTRGTWNLHLLTQEMDLDMFVLFSSAAGTIGMPGQGAYAAANVFEDALALYRCERGLPALSIAWGPWDDVGMAARPGVRDRLYEQGFDSISPEQGLGMLDVLLRRTLCGVAVLRHDSARLRHAEHRRLISPCGDKTSISDEMPPLAVLRTFPEDRRESMIERFLRRTVARVAEIDVQDVDMNRSWQSIGIDSLMAVELRSRIEQALEVSIRVEDFQTEKPVAELLREIVLLCHGIP
ncbi:MAG: type I polyketide synthase [candidate division Zixibacteria bacterium]|nr:type I polyketide synthase [candidate division Zixibacteria bacterium]